MKSVINTWDSEALSDVLMKVFVRLQKVLCLIVEGIGKNDLVETKRGKKHGNMNLRSDEDLLKIMNDFKTTLVNLDESGVTDELIDDVLDNVDNDEDDDDDDDDVLENEIQNKTN